MGLDVYLKRFEDYDAFKAREDEWESRSEPLWEIADDDKRHDALDKLASEVGVSDRWGTDPAEETIEITHPDFPDHYFKIGYWRSSYNDGGINSVVGDAIGKDLYYIAFGGRDQRPDEYRVDLDWEAAKTRCQEVHAEFKSYAAEYGFGVTSLRIGENPFGRYPDLPARPTNDNEALTQFKEIWDKHKDYPTTPSGSNWFGNSVGDFFLSPPLKVLGVIGGKGFLDIDTAYVVYEREEESLNWYLDALMIVEGTIDYVLESGEPEKFRLSWSS